MSKQDQKPTDPSASADAPPKPEAQAGFKKYHATAFNVLFDVQVKGETIYGQWADGRKNAEFLVPKHLVEGFEKHYHFTSGNIVAA